MYKLRDHISQHPALQGIRLSVVMVPALVLLSGLVISLVDVQAFLAVMQAIYSWILDSFYLGFSWIAAISLGLLIWVFFQPFAARPIGGADATRLLNPLQWASVTLCTTIAAGLMLWGVAEPLIHRASPPMVSDGSVSVGADAAQFALTSLYHHWTIMPYAIYAFTGLVIAMTHYQAGRLNAVSAPIQLIAKKPLPKALLALVDALALFAVAGGIATSLGTAILSLTGGVERLFALEGTWQITLLVAAMLVGCFLISSILGLRRGIAKLSALNTLVFAGFIVLLLYFFPPSTYGQWVIGAVVDFLIETPGRALAVDDFSATSWYKSWTSFYLAVWIAWAPLAGVFLAHIARGYSIRAFIAVNLLLPAFFSGLWLTILGGASMAHDDAVGGALTNLVQIEGVESGVYGLFAALPYADVIIAVFMVITFLSFVTAADSNILSMVQLSAPNPTAGQSLGLKILWAGLFGFTAWIMITFAGIDGVKMMSNIGGLPALIILCAYVPAFMQLVSQAKLT